MSAQPALLSPVRPPAHPLVDLRCCSCAGVEWPEADLVIADPPWTYGQQYGATAPDDHYPTLSVPEIVELLWPIRRRAPLMALWLTGPLQGEWAPSWGELHTTELVWVKSGEGDRGHYGQGYWAAGCSEPVWLYTGRGGYCDRSVPLRGAWVEPPGEHSRKPARWMRQWLQKWCPPGGLVLDPFAGLGSVAEAVLLAGEGRRYLGTEVDPERHAAALGLLAQVRA